MGDSEEQEPGADSPRERKRHRWWAAWLEGTPGSLSGDRGPPCLSGCRAENKGTLPALSHLPSARPAISCSFKDGQLHEDDVAGPKYLKEMRKLLKCAAVQCINSAALSVHACRQSGNHLDRGTDITKLQVATCIAYISVQPAEGTGRESWQYGQQAV